MRHSTTPLTCTLTTLKDFSPARKQTPRDGKGQAAEITCITAAIGAVRHRTLQERAIEVLILQVILACYYIPSLEILGDDTWWNGWFTLSAGWEVLLQHLSC